MSADLASRYICPCDGGALRQIGNRLQCGRCPESFPIVDGVPILKNEFNSVFRISDYLGCSAYGGASAHGGSLDRAGGLKKLYRRIARWLSEAPMPGHKFDPFKKISGPSHEVLVVGCGDRHVPGNVTYTDVAFSAQVQCICDAHDLPFRDGTFDVAVIESVLEHVCDPQRCVSEIVRVLRPHGFVFSVTPFLQPVHMGAHDFTRFTFLGHRRLFRHFDEVASGMCGGPIYSYIHLIRKGIVVPFSNPRFTACARMFGLLITYPMRYLDPLFARSDAAFNVGCAFYFLGSKRAAPIPDREIITYFRGT